MLIGHSRHQRPLLPVAIAAATEDDDQPMRLEFAQSLQDIEQRVGVCA